MEPKRTAAKAIVMIAMHQLIGSLVSSLSQVPVLRSKITRRMPAKTNTGPCIAYTSATRDPASSAAANTRQPKRAISPVIWGHYCRFGAIFGRGGYRRRLLDDVTHFLVVIFSIEDFPFSAAFGNRPFLIFDFQAGSLIDFFLFLQPLHEDVDNGETDRIAVFNKLYSIDRGELLCNLVREQSHLFAG